MGKQYCWLIAGLPELCLFYTDWEGDFQECFSLPGTAFDQLKCSMFDCLILPFYWSSVLLDMKLLSYGAM